ncbi:MAG: helix-turn-helix domain-containing protein, partial [Candidatus Heimdallarchaeaceae archaeon]
MLDEHDEFKSTKQVLELVGLTQDEIETYFHLTGRGPVMAGEIALIINISEEKAIVIARNLLEKGLVREIPGTTPFYIALPPYTALLHQIKRFKEIVQQIKESTPKTLQLKFKEIESHSTKLNKFNDYRNYITTMKTNLPAQIRAQFSKVEGELENVKKFQEIRGFILNLREIVPNEIIKEFDVVETRLEKIKSEISIAFEKQFRIGALKSMAEKIVSKIISEQFGDLTEYFREKFVNTIQGTLDQVTDQLASISDVAGEMSIDLGNFLSDIVSGLEETLGDLDGRIASVYEDVDKGIEELKSLFQREIYKTLEEDVMTNVLEQLDLSEKTMTEFWERSKVASMLSFKDVWFVRSVEGMKAQINESFTRIKAKIYIIAPKLEDIDIVAISKVKKFINVRISANFDTSNPKDQLILAEIVKYPNINVRLYSRENLYSVNRDFEEVVICAASKNEYGVSEIAGMGSLLNEHVKLFAPVLEDVWIQSKKVSDRDILHSIESSKVSNGIKAPIDQPNYKSSQTPSILHEIEMQSESPLPPIKNEVIKTIEESPTYEAQPTIPKQVDVPPTPTLEESIKISKPSSDLNTDTTPKGSISEILDDFVSNLDKKIGPELSNDLEYIQKRITEDIGYASILNPMSITIATLRATPDFLSPMEIEDVVK